MNAPLLGCIPNTFDARDHLLARSEILAGEVVLASEDVDHRRFTPPNTPQISNNCCAHGTKKSVMGRASFVGRPLPDLSVAFLYTVARQQRKRPQDPLMDEGSSLRSMYEGMRTYGLVREQDWPERGATVNMIPADHLYREGEGLVVDAYYKIADGASSADEIKAALRRGYLPVFAMFVDERFQSIGNRVYDGTGGVRFGAHAMVVVGYVSALDAFLVANSWADFGFEEGHCLISADFMNRQTFDKMVATHVG